MLLWPRAAHPRSVADVLAARVAEHDRARAVQERIDAALGRSLSAADILAAQQLSTALARAAAEVEQTRVQVAELEATATAREQARAELVPLLHNMLDLLARSIEQDLPIDLPARRAAVDAARGRLDDAAASASDRLAAVLAIYTREQRLAASVARVRSRVAMNDTERAVTLIRFGRVALYALADNAHECAVFVRATRQWQPLPATRCKALINAPDNAPLATLSQLPWSVEAGTP